MRESTIELQNMSCSKKESRQNNKEESLQMDREIYKEKDEKRNTEGNKDAQRNRERETQRQLYESRGVYMDKEMERGTHY